MIKLQLDTKGFGAIGILVVIAVLVIAGGAGVYVYHRDHKTTTTTKNAATNTSKQAPSSSQPAHNNTTATLHTASDAVALVQDTYTAALNYVKQTTRADQGEIDAVKPNLSSTLFNQLTASVAEAGHDVILCGQMRPDSFTVSAGPTASGVTTSK